MRIKHYPFSALFSFFYKNIVLAAALCSLATLPAGAQCPPDNLLSPGEVTTERGRTISLTIPNLPAGYAAVWYAEDGTTELYASTDNDFQPLIERATTFYGAIRQTESGCGSELVPVTVLAYYPLSVRTESYNASCAGRSDGAVQAIIKGGRQSIGTGNFEYSEERYEYSGYKILVGDFNNDGYPDLYESSYNTYDNVWLNDGDGTFTYQRVNYNSVQSGRNAVAGDFDGDGDLDIYVANRQTASDKVLINDGTGFFTERQESYGINFSEGADVGDINGDDFLDVVVTGGNFAVALLGNGDGTFTQQASFGNAAYSSNQVRLGDLDGDGDLDAFVANGDLNLAAESFNPNKVYLNDGNGTFTEVAEDYGSFESSWEVSLADVDNDGDLDAFVANWENYPNRLYLNDGDGTFTESTQSFNTTMGRSVAFGDFDRDGDLDAFTTYQNTFASTGSAVYWINDGAGVFSPGPTLGRTGGTDAGVADFDQDGDLDVFCAFRWTHIFETLGRLHHVLWNDDSSLTPYQLEWNGGAPTTTTTYVTGIRAGSYSVQVTDSDGNTVDTPYEVFDDDPIVLNATVVDPTCTNTNDGSATVTVSGGGPFQFASQEPVFGSPFTGDALILEDLDNDNDLDFIGGRIMGINDGTGIFTEVNEPSFPQGYRKLAVGDLDGDGDPDIPSVNSSVLSIWRNNGNLTFTTPDTYTTTGALLDDIDLGDLDNDGDLDLFLTDKTSRPNQVWLNDGSGNFTPTTDRLGSEDTWNTALGDLDGDGDLDAFCANLGSGSVIYTNDGSGKFDQHYVLPSGIAGQNLALGDLDGDGDLDAVVDNYVEQPTLIYLNNGDATFTVQEQKIPNPGVFEIELGDFDLDGDLDILTSKRNVPFGNKGGIFWLNDGAANFIEYRINATSLNLFFPSNISETGDIDGDGDLDVVSLAGNGYQFYINSPMTYTYQWDANAGSQTTAEAVELSVGTYGVTATDFRGCAESTTVILDAPPGGVEICDGEDNDCDGLIDEGFDLDGDGYTSCAGDCDDNDPNNFPGNPETCDGQDNNCDGQIDEGFDADNDGVTSCAGDCDDNDPNNFPGNTETCDGQDNNCDGQTDEGFDADGDGVADCFDNCTNLYNPDQTDADCDGIGDACDQWPGCDDSLDTDGDGTPDCVDLDELDNWECHQNGKKAYVCHIPPGNPANQHTICISKNAVGTHLNNHGDYIGECYQVTCGGNGRPGYGGTALIDRALEANDFHLYPNPSSGAITVNLSGYMEQKLSISIYNALGREVYRQKIQVVEEALLNIGLTEKQLPDGVYWLAVQADEGRMVKQFVLAR